MVKFNTIPPGIRAPGFYPEIDSSRATLGSGDKPFQGLLIGGRTTAGAVAQKIRTRIASLDEATAAFGPGSMLEHMARAWFATNGSTPLDAIAVDDAGGGTAATFTITTTVTTAVAGSLYLYAANVRKVIAVTAGQTQNSIATAIYNALNADTSLPFTVASPGANIVTLTAKNKGTPGNDLDIRFNYQAGETNPSGVTTVVAAGATGATNPTLDGTLTSAIGEDQFDEIALGWNDATSCAWLVAELASRFGYARSNDGRGHVGFRGTASAIDTFAATHNSRDLTVWGFDSSPTWTPSIAAAAAARAAFDYSIDPSLPLNTQPLDYVMAPAPAARFTLAQREAHLNSGAATWTVDAAGVVRVDRHVTTYRLNAASAPDTAWLDGTTVATVSFYRWSVATRFRSKFGRFKLADDGTRFAPDQPILTPSLAKAELLALAREWEEVGRLENFDDFKANVVAERNATDTSRLDILLPPNLVNGLHVTAAKIQFRL